MARRLTSNVTIYTNGAKGLGEQLVLGLTADVGIKVDERPIARLEKGATEPEVIIHLVGGLSITEGFLVRFTFAFLIKRIARSILACLVLFSRKHALTEFQVHKPRTEINGPFARQLSLELTEQGDIKTTPPFYESSIPGVFAAGDCTTPLKAVSQAVAMGTFVAAGVVGQLGVDRL